MKRKIITSAIAATVLVVGMTTALNVFDASDGVVAVTVTIVYFAIGLRGAQIYGELRWPESGTKRT